MQVCPEIGKMTQTIKITVSNFCFFTFTIKFFDGKKSKEFNFNLVYKDTKTLIFPKRVNISAWWIGLLTRMLFRILSSGVLRIRFFFSHTIYQRPSGARKYIIFPMSTKLVDIGLHDQESEIWYSCFGH